MPGPGEGDDPSDGPSPTSSSGSHAGGASAPEPTGDRPHGVSTFSLEGRSVPALYVVGWVASLVGAMLLFVSLAANVPGAGGWLFLAGLVVLAVGLVGAAGSQAIEHGRQPDLAYRGPSPVLVFLLVVVLTFLALVIVLAPLSALGLDVRSPLAKNPPPDATVDLGELAAAMARLRAETGAPICVTCGAGGMVASDPEPTHVPGVRVEGPIDPTGAGDSATAGAVLALTSGAQLPEAALVANLVASITIQQLATTGTARPDQLAPRLALWLQQRRGDG